MNKKYILGLILSLTLVFFSAEGFAKKPSKKRVLVYAGQLLGDHGGPIGGVFPLTFSFHTKSRGGKSVWSEHHFVGIDDGRYVIELGRKVRVPSRLRLGDVYLAVSQTGGPELVRERFVPASETSETIIRHKNVPVSPTGVRHRAGGSSQNSDFARRAERASYADRAGDAERLSGVTLEKLKKQLQRDGGSSGVIVSDRDLFETQSKGGGGGSNFNLACPKGYVVTGIRGSAGMYVDRLSLICSKLESSK
jgi:hypothetical protein